MRQYSIKYLLDHVIQWGSIALNTDQNIWSDEAMQHWICIGLCYPLRLCIVESWSQTRNNNKKRDHCHESDCGIWAILLSILSLGFPSTCQSPGDKAWKITSSNLCSLCRSFHLGAVGCWGVQPLPLWSRHGLSRVQDRGPSTVEARGWAAADRDDGGEGYCATCRRLGYIQISAYLLYMASCNVLSVC